MNYPPELFEKAPSQNKANDMIKKFYDYRCPFTDRYKRDGWKIEASHIAPIGRTKYKSLCRIPIAAIPMYEIVHTEFEWEVQNVKKRLLKDRLLFIEQVLEDYEIEDKQAIRDHVQAFLWLCDDLGVDI